jgi:hypothetical protein
MSQNVALLNIDETTISDELIDVLRSQNITDVYLYTDKKFTEEQLAKIDALKVSFEQQNLTIRGCISPIDLVWKSLAKKELLEPQKFVSLQTKITTRLNENMTALYPKKISQIDLSNSNFGSTYSRIKNPKPDEQFSKDSCIQVMQDLSKLIIDNVTSAPHSSENFALLLKEIFKVNNIETLTAKEIKEQHTHRLLSIVKTKLITLDLVNKKEKTLKQKGLELVTYAEKLLKQKTKLDDESLNDLLDVLSCANKAIDERENHFKTKENATELAKLSEKFSKKSSSIWKKIGAVLLTIACAALVVAGVLAAIPSGGSSLLLSTIGGIGLASQIGIGVGIGVTAGLGAASLAKGLKANPVTKFKAALEKPTDFEDSPLNVEKINQGPASILHDWKRLQEWKVTIDGKPIKELLPKELHTVKSFDDDTLKAFIMEHILKNIPETDNQRKGAYTKIRPYFHQGGLLHPVTSAAALCVMAKRLAPNSDQVREINIRTTTDGFEIQEILTQKTITNPTKEIHGEPEILKPDHQGTYVYKAQGTIDINFNASSSEGLPFKLTVLSNTISYGNEEVKKALTSTPELIASGPRGLS